MVTQIHPAIYILLFLKHFFFFILAITRINIARFDHQLIVFYISDTATYDCNILLYEKTQEKLCVDVKKSDKQICKCENVRNDSRLFIITHIENVRNVYFKVCMNVADYETTK